jgi:hypothetical protein
MQQGKNVARSELRRNRADLRNWKLIQMDGRVSEKSVRTIPPDFRRQKTNWFRGGVLKNNSGSRRADSRASTRASAFPGRLARPIFC